MKIDIIIPTYQRPISLYRLLRLINQQYHIDFDSLSVFVINDGSHTELYRDVTSRIYRFSLNYIELPREDYGPAMCRNTNLAAEMGNGDIIVLFDDALIIDPHTIFIHKLYHQLLPKFGVPRPAIFPKEVFSNVLLQQPENIEIQNPETGLVDVWVTNGCSSVRREDWVAVGGLDEIYDGSMGFDDRDFAIRLYNAGCAIISAAGITRYNEDSESGGSWTAKIANQDNHINADKFFERWPEYKNAEWGVR